MSIYAPKKPKKINAVSVTVTLVLAVIGYLGWFYLPHWFSVWSASGRMIGVGRDAYREFDDQKIMDKLVREVRAAGLRVGPENFELIREKYTPEELQTLTQGGKGSSHVWERRGKTFTVKLAYQVQAKWPLMEKVTPLVFRAERKVDLQGKLQ
jgi:hypothetical protein